MFPRSPVWALTRPRGEVVRVAGRVTANGAEHFSLEDAFGAVVIKKGTAAGASLVAAGVYLVADVRAFDGPLPLVSVVDASAAITGPHVRSSEQRAVRDQEKPSGLIARAEVLAALRAYFARQDFLEVETPTFGVCPGLDPHVHALGEVRAATGAHLGHLMTSPEFFLKRLLSRGYPRIFEVSRVFRAEELGAIHEPEFSLLEWYRAYQGLDDVIADAEALLREAAARVQQTDRPAIAVGPPHAQRRIDLNSPARRMRISEAFEEFAGRTDALALAEGYPEQYFQIFVDQVEPGLARQEVPIVLTHFPASQAALARLTPGDPRTAERFELVVGGVELANGYWELTDPVEQRQRFVWEQTRRRATGEPVYPLDEKFLAALESGMPPASGCALGIDRLIALSAGLQRIDSTLSFPQSLR